MGTEMHLNSFAPPSRFTKEISFRTLRELSDEQNDSRVNMANNVMVTNNGNAISKSSSSDSDTNSATRLLDNDHDFRTMGYLLLTPANVSTTINDATVSSQDVLWSQMQNSLSNEIRNRYIIKNDFTRQNYRREYRIVGMHCYLSTIKLVITVLLVILVCSIVFSLMGLVVARHINRMTPDDPNRHSDMQWWHDATFYEIFPASFKDSDGDGYGDIQGLREKVTYLKELGIDAVRFNSIFAALDYPHRYDNVLDFKSVDPHIGKTEDFVSLVNDLRSVNIKVILDVNPTTTSDQHPWAAHWLLNKLGEYKYFYVNVSDGHANDLEWTSSGATDRLQSDMEKSHLTFGGQLFLNWSHATVRSKMLDVFNFWLDYVDGFYLKHLDHLRIDADSQLYDILSQLRDVLNRKLTVTQTRKILICSSDFISKRHTLLLNYGRGPLETNDAPSSVTNGNSSNGSKIIDISTYFDLIDFQLNMDINKTETIRDQVNAVFLNAPTTFPWIHWSMGDVSDSRLATRIGSQYTITSAFLLTMLPGTISVFYGDEIGLEDTIDIVSNKEYRGGQLCPMQWSSNLNANFTLSNVTLPWLPIHPNYTHVNVAKQIDAIKRFNQLTQFRRYNFDSLNTGKHGNYLFHYIDDSEIVFERYFDSRDTPSTETRYRYVLFANFGNRPKIKDFSDKFHFSRIKISSNPKRAKEFLYMRSFRLEPAEAMIVEVE